MNVGLKRNNNEKYYTKKEIVKLCIEEIVKLNIVESKDLIIEPSCGNGAFIEDIKNLSTEFIFIDIEPENEEISKSDYLDFKINKDATSKIHIIGNPPFGRQSSLANKFIKKSCEFCDSISFILPRSFKKDSMKKIFPLNYHLLFEMDLPDESFLVNDKSYNVPCIFQIWIKKDFNRDVIEKNLPLNFTFVKQDETPDISFRRVGVNAGLISKKIDKSPQSHYFIKFTNDKSIDEIIENLSNVSFNFNNTVGPKSISKQELICEFNKYLNS